LKTFNQIKLELVEKNYSKKDIKQGIFAYTIVKSLFSKFSFFVISAIPFLIGLCIVGFTPATSLFYLVIHLFFFKFYVEKIYNKDIKPLSDELSNIIKAFKEIKSENF
jgi:hypothetical protein